MISYRRFRDEDYEAVLQMVMVTWNYYEWVPGHAARAMASYYLSEILAQSDEVWVADRGGEPVGIIAGRDCRRRITRLRYHLRKVFAALCIYVGRQAVDVFEQFVRTEKLDAELLAEADAPFDGELTLLIVMPSCKGQGVGDALYGRFLEWVHLRGMRSFYLFTDSSCNVGFYKHKGLRNLGGRTFYWAEHREEGDRRTPEEYYLYAGMLA